jgi:hypothetical protein
MMAINPNIMMIDGGDNPTIKSTLTQAQIQAAVRKLSSGQPLTVEEQAAVGVTTNIAPTGYDWTEGKAELDQLAAEARAAAAAANAAAAEAKTRAEKLTADKLKAEADAKAKAAADAKASADAKAKAGVVTAPTPTSPTGLKTAAQIAAETAAAAAKGERQSAYDLLYSQFKQYGLESLVTPLQNLIISGASPSEFTIKLRDSEAYKKRFAANADRIKNGLKAVSEAEYLGLEDQYQNIMRNYGLPAEYYTRGEMGTQEGFQKFIANDVSATELEDRVITAQSRVLNSNPEVLASLKSFYPDITNGDILAYALNPTKALTDIKRKVTAAEIGGAAVQSGLNLGNTPEQRALYAARAAELGAAGVTKAQAQQGFQTVAEVAPRGGQLAEIYKQSPYTQTTAEAEVFGLAGSAEAARQRKKLTSLETAAFSGSAGAGAIARDRAGAL